MLQQIETPWIEGYNFGVGVDPGGTQVAPHLSVTDQSEGFYSITAVSRQLWRQNPTSDRQRHRATSNHQLADAVG